MRRHAVDSDDTHRLSHYRRRTKSISYGSWSAHSHDSGEHAPGYAGHGTNRMLFEKSCGPCASSRPLKERRIPAIRCRVKGRNSKFPVDETLEYLSGRREKDVVESCGSGTVPEGFPSATVVQMQPHWQGGVPTESTCGYPVLAT